MATNILLLCGGDGSEHKISLLSAQFIEEQLKLTTDFKVVKAEIHNHQFLVDGKTPGYLKVKTLYMMVLPLKLTVWFLVFTAFQVKLVIFNLS